MAKMYEYRFNFTAKADTATRTFNKIKRSLSDIDKYALKAKKSLNNAFSSVKGGNTLTASVNAGRKLLDVTMLTALSFVTINQEAELLRAKLTTVTGSIEASEGAFQTMLNKATEMPFTIDAIVDSFSKLKAAGIDDAAEYVDSLTNAVSAFGGNSEDLRFATMAIQQMVGKGVISMEEMRRQLAERIPTSMRIMADAVGMSMSELITVISSGAAKTSDYLDPMIKKMQEMYGGANERMMNTFSGSLQKVRTAWTKLMIDIGDGKGSFQSLRGAIDSVATSLNAFRTSASGKATIDNLSSGLKSFFDELIANANKLPGYIDIIVAGFRVAASIAKVFAKSVLWILDSLEKVAVTMQILGAGLVFVPGMQVAGAAIAGAGIAAKYLNDSLSDARNELGLLVDELGKPIVAPLTDIQIQDNLEITADLRIQENFSDIRSKIKGFADAAEKDMKRVEGQIESLVKEIDGLNTSLNKEIAQYATEEFELRLTLLSPDKQLETIRAKILDLQTAADSIDLSKAGGFERQRDLLAQSKQLIMSLSEESSKASKEDVDKALKYASAMVDRARSHSTSSTRQQANDAIRQYNKMKDSFNGIFSDAEKKDAIQRKVDSLEEVNKKLLENRQNEIKNKNDQLKDLDELHDKYKQIYDRATEDLNAFGSDNKIMLTLWATNLDDIESKYNAIATAAQKATNINVPGSTKLEGALASGGDADAGKSYLIGEKGPEIFTPSKSGYVTPNNELGKSAKTSNLSISLGGSQLPTIYGATKKSVDAFIDYLKESERLAA